MFNDKNREPIALYADEHIVKQAETSIASLVITYISVPAILLVVYLPRIIKNLIIGKVVEAVGFGSGLLSFFSAVLTVITVILGIVWAGVCVVMTLKHFSYSLTITDFRVIGSARHAKVDAPLSEVVNVFLEQPLLGKLFHYGSINVYTRRGSVTVKNLKNPEEIYRMLLSKAEENGVKL